MAAEPSRLISGFLTVGGWTLASRVMGFARDIMIAAFLGTGVVAEAFLVAFALPNMFRRFFAEGAFNMAFVPMFSKRVEAGENPKGFAQDAFSGMLLILAAFTILGIVFMPALVFAMASGFAEDERFGLAVAYGRIAFPYILLISLAALLSGVLNATGRFLAAAAAPVLLNIVFVAAMLVGWAMGRPLSDGLGFGIDEMLGLRVGDTLALSVPLAGLVQFALVWWAAARAGFRLTITRPRLTPEMKRLAIIAAPAALSGGVVQINLLVGRQVASFFDGAIAWLTYADRLYQLPLGVVGIAIGVVLLPDLSRRLRAEDTAGGQHALSRAAEFALTLTIPCTVAFLVIPMPLVVTLFERGAFGPDDSAATALAVAIYGLGLPAFVMQKVWQPLYFAREDTTRPFYFALAALVVNAAAAIGLAPVMGFAAAAIGTTLAGWIMAVLLVVYARPMGEAARLDARFRHRLPRTIAASAGMGAVLFAGQVALGPLLGSEAKYLGLLLLVGLGIASYALLCHLTGAMRLAELKGMLRRRRA